MRNRIKQARQNVGLSQKQLAEKIGISDAAISKIESGVNNPAPQTIIAICAVLGVSRHWLETGEGDMYVESTAQTLDAIAARYNGSQTFRAMLDVYVTLTPQDQDAVERYIRLLAQALENGEPPELVRPDYGQVLDDLGIQADPDDDAQAE